MIYYSYDVMFTLAFGHPMGFVKGEQNDVAQSILNTMTGGLTAMGVLMHTPAIVTLSLHELTMIRSKMQNQISCLT
jgi:hypothetical protein